MKLVKFFAIAVAAFAVACAPEEQKVNKPNFELTESKILCDVSAAGWENCNAYAWTDAGELLGSWPGTELTEKEGDYYVWVAPAEICGQTIGFILNNGTEQTVDINIVVSDGLVVALTEKGADGKWLASGGDVVVPEQKPEPVIVFGDHTYGLIGSFAASDNPKTEDKVGWELDVPMNIVDGWATATVELEANDEFKVRLDGDWADSYGFAATEEMAEFPVNGTQFAATYNAGNLKVVEAGTYEVSFTIEGENEYFKVLKK